MLTVHSSNRLERLADALSAEIKARPQPPLIPEMVVVQSLGARRWLSFALAQRLGVAMNLEFPFPSALVERAFHALAPAPISPIFRRDVLPWKLHALLPELWDAPGFESLRGYASADPVKLWELAGQVAAVFDRYLAYRPNLLRSWDAGQDDPEHPWQSKLWRALADGGPHAAALAERAQRAPAEANHKLPARISVFGLNTLPPFHLALLGELGRRTDVHLFVLAPTEEYWGDLRSDREKRRYRSWRERRGKSIESEQDSDPHPLLASLGKIGREFHEAVLDLEPAKEPTYFEEPAGEGLLPQLQRGILRLETPAPDERPIYDAKDRSIHAHNCHSPMRELEVLHDQLLALFQADESLEPRDVLVSVPDIGAFAPFIDAVFGAAETDHTRFPYSIADRDRRSQNRVTDAFLRVLDLVGSRFPASAVLSVIECPPVTERFGIADAELPLLRKWIAESGVCWGLSGEHRAQLGFPKWEENTWQFGLDRLLLSFALPSTGSDLFAGILPHGDVEGSLAETLGKFATCCATIFRICESLGERARPIEEWAQVVTASLDELCASDGDFADHWHEAAQTVEALAANAELAGHTLPIPFAVIREHLGVAIGGHDPESEFLRGGITFCSLKPMRAVPHRIVALLGMNDTAFPRSARPPSFDLTASHPQAGDRATRDDDRYLFLESILSARDVFYLSYCGQSAKDDSTSPPSVLVVELLDFLAKIHQVPDKKTPHAHLVTRHPLQSYDRAYFAGADARLFSYSREAFLAAKAAAGVRVDAPAFVGASVPAKERERSLSIDQLASFLVHPSKYFAQEIMGMRQAYEEASIEDVEPIELDGREHYAIRQEMADVAMRGGDPRALDTLIRASGALPQGISGEITLGTAAAEVRKVATLVQQHAPGEPMPDRYAEISVGDWQLRGFISGQRGGRLAQVRPATVQTKDLARAWCLHLFACAAEPAAGHTSLVIGTEDSRMLRTVSNAAEELEKLLALFALGCTRPLPLFPATSEAFAAATLPPKSKSAADGRKAAEIKWHGGMYSNAEKDDVWNRLIWRAPAEPLGKEWEELAVSIFGPLIAHREDLE